MPLSKDDLLKLAVRMTNAMQEDAFAERVRAKLAEKNTPPTQAVMEEFEAIQEVVFSEWGFDGPDVLRQMKTAVRVFPGPDTQMAISQLCAVEEQLLMVLAREVATRFGQVLPDDSAAAAGSHGHSHNGQPCHGHHGHGHSHGGSHGHSHNGQPCHGHGHSHGHGGPNEQQMLAMRMAMESLSPEQKANMQSIHAKMMTGQRPTAEDQRKMASIQQHLMAYMATMQQLVQQTASAAPPS